MKKVILGFCFLFIVLPMAAQDQTSETVVSIYDEFDDGLFGKSRHRGVIVSVKKGAFARAESFDVKEDGEQGYLTAVVMDKETVEKLESGYYGLPFSDSMGYKIYHYDYEGLDFSFSVEPANKSILQMVSDFYSNDPVWHDPLVKHYEENYVIRVHRTENVFDSWSEDITYNEAMIAATLVGDKDQWLWGIHNGADILNSGFHIE
jgi:hypothetical protein